MNPRYPMNLQVKQFVAKVRGAFATFMVFETGDPKFYLFDMLDPHGCSTTIQFPVRKSELKPEIRSMLRHGYGNT